MPDDNPTTSTGRVLLVIELLPSWPASFAPQHLTPPAAVIAQAWESPTAMARTPDDSPVTTPGVAFLRVIVPLPRWPASFAPQHITAPPAVNAQAKSPPAP